MTRQLLDRRLRKQPAYLCNLFVPRTPNYDFLNAKKKLLFPKPRTDYLKRSFSYSGAILWNNLPEETRYIKFRSFL